MPASKRIVLSTELNEQAMTQVFWSGCYSADLEGRGVGIGVLRRRDDGTLHYLGTALHASSPSALVQHPLLGDVLYATLEGSERLEAFRRTGELTLESLGSQPAPGPFPCHGSVARDGKTLFTASYGSGALGLSPLSEDGSLQPLGRVLHFKGNGPRPAQGGAHGHTAMVLDQSTLINIDLGTDEVRLFEIVQGDLRSLHTLRLPRGSGPRDLLVHPSGFLYVLTELSNEVFVLNLLRERAQLSIVGSTPLVDGSALDASKAAVISVSGDGNYVYAGVRGANVIATLSVREGGRRLERIAAVSTRGDWPRHHIVDGQFLYVCNQLSDTVASFTLNARTGVPEPLGEPEHVPSPTFLLRATPARDE